MVPVRPAALPRFLWDDCLLKFILQVNTLPISYNPHFLSIYLFIYFSTYLFYLFIHFLHSSQAIIHPPSFYFPIPAVSLTRLSIRTIPCELHNTNGVIYPECITSSLLSYTIFPPPPCMLYIYSHIQHIYLFKAIYGQSLVN